MSHFSVLVIGDDVEDQLAPYDENLQMEGVREDIIPEDVEQARSYFHKTYEGYEEWVTAGSQIPDPKDENYNKVRIFRAIEQGEIPSLDADDLQILQWYHGGQEVFIENHDDEPVYYRYNTYNPDSKWDWYQVGGRWAGFLKLKDEVTAKPPDFSWGWDEASKKEKLAGNWTDQARKGDIDLEGMRTTAAEKAGERWDQYYALVAGTPPLIPWEEVHLIMFPDDIVKAREFYHGQARMKKLREDKTNSFFWDPAQYEVSREDYVQNAYDNAIATFAILKDGEWIEKGQMGWFGMACNEMDQKDWNKQFNAMIDELPDDTLLTVVDCHI